LPIKLCTKNAAKHKHFLQKRGSEIKFLLLLFTFYFLLLCPFALLAEKLHNKKLFKAMKFLSNIRLLALGLWLGAAVFFSFAVAPGAFAVLPSREAAGAIVSRSLTIVNISGLTIGLILLASSFVGAALTNRFALWTERILLLLLTAGCAVGQFVIALWLSLVKAQMGKPIDEIALDDPLRIKFNNLHEYSVWILVAAMIAAVIAFFIISGKSFGSSAPKTVSKDFDFDKEFKI
jgi:hypothetical protein